MKTPKTKLSKELDYLKNELHKRGYPFDKYKNHSFLLPLEPSDPPEPNFTELLDELYRQTVGGRTKADAEELKRHWVYFLLGLSGSVITHKWLTVFLTKSDYSKTNSWLKEFNFKDNTVRRIVEHLEKAQLAVVLKGAPYKNEPMRTRIYPTPDFAVQILPFYLSSRESFHGNYLEITPDHDREPVDKIDWQKEFKGQLKDTEDHEHLNRINEYLKEQHWACTGPVVLEYKKKPFHSGRLYTRYQQLPDRHYKIRINTLVNNEPICEVDLNANHLRLAMAVLHEEDAGDTPYEDIMWLADIQDRDLVKSFFMTAIGASSRSSAHSRWNLNSGGTDNFRKIENAVIRRFPDLKLYDNWGISARNLEGAILREVMLAGIKKDIVVLPVHDAVAVQQRHEGWAVDAMLESWNKHVGHDFARVKVDRP